MSFGERLKKVRKMRGLTQQDLADKLELPRPTMAGYETKGYEPNFETLKRIANALDVSIDYLLDNIEKPNINDENKTIAAYSTNNKLSKEDIEDIMTILNILKKR